ncbi:protoporphyrinogen oxidase HemJ [Rhizobium sp. RM]|uniref:protoporphyrinogen oxidase HemJ n=1 Tax=Rhizobium sp. RM TaxID=2748079 RepID=UPI0015B5E9C9|nr:protoporphyrinogen oxidase HemJ [Rhizobium sp. RM]NWJ23137.1 protoporphyrinogen oxidase HemJ [Rhizobium sp. RM]
MSEEKQTSVRAGSRAAFRAATALCLFGIAVALIFFSDPADLYLWIKALHIIAVISWMAAIFYLPRLFIYHTDAPVGSQQSETFKVMEQRLVKIIMNPAMMISWVLGLYLAWSVYGFSGGWLHAKIGLVVLLTVTHVYFTRSAKRFARDENTRSARHWRLMNEVPTLLMIVIVILVVVKPFV